MRRVGAEVAPHLVIADVHVMLIRKVVEAIAATGPDISEREKRRTALTLRETLEVGVFLSPPPDPCRGLAPNTAVPSLEDPAQRITRRNAQQLD
jgi:hypothetical protein